VTHQIAHGRRVGSPFDQETTEIVPQVVESDSWHFGGLASLDPQSDDLRHGQVEGEALGGDFGRFRGKRNEARAPGLRAAVDAYRAADNIGRSQTQGFRTPQAGERRGMRESEPIAGRPCPSACGPDPVSAADRASGRLLRSRSAFPRAGSFCPGPTSMPCCRSRWNGLYLVFIWSIRDRDAILIPSQTHQLSQGERR
jgi:hypothetical protein